MKGGFKVPRRKGWVQQISFSLFSITDCLRQPSTWQQSCCGAFFWHWTFSAHCTGCPNTAESLVSPTYSWVFSAGRLNFSPSPAFLFSFQPVSSKYKLHGSSSPLPEHCNSGSRMGEDGRTNSLKWRSPETWNGKTRHFSLFRLVQAAEVLFSERLQAVGSWWTLQVCVARFW